MGYDDDPTLAAPLAPLAPLAPFSDASATDVALAATRVIAGRYEILGLLGMGGMGVVYRAKDLELGEIVALKALRADYANGADAHARFRKEVRLARRVTHKNVARTYDLGEAQGHRFLTMELVPGHTLGELLDKRGALAIARALDITLSICAGVAAAHEAGVIHRDLKPDNVIIADDGRVVVMDFGVAREIDEDGEGVRIIIGTPAYMAPEQAENIADLDGRADQYAIGTILYEMVTGQPPFPGNSLMAFAQRLMRPPPDPMEARPEVGVPLSAIIQRCMARARADRFPTIARLIEELRALRGEGGPTASRALSGLPPKPAREAPAIAVLTFELTGPPGAEHVAQGVSDRIIDALSLVDGLRVHSRGITSHIRGSHAEVRDGARLIGAELVVTGTVRVRGDEMTARMQLLTVADGFSIWSRCFVGKVADVVRCADEAAHALALELGVSPPAVQQSLTDPAAVDLYLRGRCEYFRYSPAANARAVEFLRLASARAPDDPVILSAYAMATILNVGLQVEYSSPLDTARQAAERAYLLGPDRVESLVALGTVALHATDGKLAGELAARAFKMAVGRGSADLCALAARLLLGADAVEEGTSYVDLAIAQEPRYGGLRYLAARAAALTGDWSEAERVFLHAPVDRVSPFLYWLDRVRVCYWRGDSKFIDGADMANIQGLDAHEQQLAVGSAEIVRDRRISPELAKYFSQLNKSVGVSPRMKVILAELTTEARCYLGLYDEATRSLLRAVEHGSFELCWIRDCPALAPLRARPEVISATAIVRERAEAVRLALGVVQTARGAALAAS